MKECHGKYSQDGLNQCPHCDKTAVGFKALKRHVRGLHRGGGKCKDCDLVFKNDNSLRGHWDKEGDL